MNQLICFVLSQISYACLFISRRPRLCMKSFLISHVAIHTLSRDWSDRALRKRSADRNVWTTLLSAFVPNITGVHEEMNYCKCCNKHTVVCIWTDFTYHRVDKCWRYGNTCMWTSELSLYRYSVCHCAHYSAAIPASLVSGFPQYFSSTLQGFAPIRPQGH